MGPSLLASSLRSSTGASIKRRNLIVDTDMGFDDLIAIRILSQMLSINLSLVTSVDGINTAKVGAQCARCLLPSTTVVAGSGRQNCRKGGNESWLPAYKRRFHDFAIRNKLIASRDDKSHVNGSDALDAFIDTLETLPDGGCDLMCLGPLTNVATWLLSPKAAGLMAKKVDAVWILGGNHPHESTDAEFNFKEDSQAASDVLSSPHVSGKLRIVTADISGLQSAQFAGGLVESVGAAAEECGGLLSDALRTSPDAVFHDPVCAFAYMNPNLFRSSHLNARVDPESGLVIEDISGPDGMKTHFVSHRNSASVKREYIDWVSRAMKLEAAIT